MKRISLLLAIFTSSLLLAQNSFEGTISYKITYEDMAEEMKAVQAMLPKESTVVIKEEISKTITPNGMGGETIQLIDAGSGEMLSLMNIMGNKLAVKQDKEDLMGEIPEIQMSDETKEILGYQCKKVSFSNEQGEIEIFYTNELKNIKTADLMLIPSIDGFPLEMIVSTDFFTSTKTVTEIREEKVKKIKMEIPADYTIKTNEELKQMMGGGM